MSTEEHPEEGVRVNDRRRIDPETFELIEETSVPAGEKDKFPTRYAIYRRRDR